MTRRSSTVPLDSVQPYTVPLSVLVLSTLLSAFGVVGTCEAQVAEEAESKPVAGREVFLAKKCHLCHAVPAAEIEAKTKSEKLKGKDLGGPVEEDFEVMAAYLRKQRELRGNSHKKEFKGRDEELQVILDWLAELEPVEAEGS